MSDNRLTFEEVTDLFGGTIPMEALVILTNAPDDKTVEEVRDEITNLALKWHRRVPAPAVPDDVAKIVAELRVIGCHENGDARCTCGIGMDAADALEAQATELARYREALQPFASAWRIAQASGLTGMSQLGSLARNEVAAVAFMKAAALTHPTGDQTNGH